MELKSLILTTTTETAKRSNRTFMELKSEMAVLI